MNGTTQTEPPAQVGRWVIISATSGTVLIGLGAFLLSFTALADLASRSGITAGLAWIWPLIVDGVIVVATISVVALSRHGKGATRYAWLLLAGGAAVSVSANITHATVTASTQVPSVLAAMVASIPPIVLLAITHLTVLLTRYRNPPTGSPPTRQPLTRPAAHQAAGAVLPVKTPKSLEAPPRGARTPTVRDRGGGEDARAKARELSAQGRSNRSIAAEVGVHPSTVGRWLGHDRSEEHTKESTRDNAEEDNDGTE